MGDLGATYDDHLRLIRKRVGDFLLVLIKLFSLGVMAEALQAIIGSKSAISLKRGAGLPKISCRMCRPTNHSFSPKTGLNGHSYGITIWTDFSFVFFSQSTRLTDGWTDRQTDGRTQRIPIARARLHSMQRGKKMKDLLS